MNQLCLVLPMPRARRRDPHTSKIAALRATEFAEHHVDVIRAALKQGPATIYELAERTGLDHVAIARRMVEMQVTGMARVRRKADGSPETRQGKSGRPCRVWEAC